MSTWVTWFIGLGLLLIGWWDIARWTICKDVYWFHDKINIIHAVMMAFYIPLSIPLIYIIPHFQLLHKQNFAKKSLEIFIALMCTLGVWFLMRISYAIMIDIRDLIIGDYSFDLIAFLLIDVLSFIYNFYILSLCVVSALNFVYNRFFNYTLVCCE